MEQTYEIKRVTGDVKWEEIPALEMGFTYLNTPADTVTAFGQICAGEEALYVHLWAKQRQIRAEEFGISGLPYQDSCLEFFFRPEEEDPRYFNLEFNFNKCLYLGIGTDGDDLERILLADREALFKPVTRQTEQGWEIFYQIPYAFIRRYFPSFSVYAGKTLWANCFTCSDLAEVPYYRSWSQVIAEPFTFHIPKCFGKMKIV